MSNSDETNPVISEPLSSNEIRSPDNASSKLEGGFYEFPGWAVVLGTMGLAILVTLTGIWQLLLLVGFLAGALPRDQKASRGFLFGFLGGLCAWVILFGIYLVSTEMGAFVERVFVEVAGLHRAVLPLVFLACAAFGGVITGLGGLNGVFGSRLIQWYRQRNPQE